MLCILSLTRHKVSSKNVLADQMIADMKERNRQIVYLVTEKLVARFSRLYDKTKEQNKVHKFILREFQENIKNHVLNFPICFAEDTSDVFEDLVERLDCEPQQIYGSCFKEVARALWKQPQLLYHGLPIAEYQTNTHLFEKLVRRCVKDAIAMLKINAPEELAKVPEEPAEPEELAEEPEEPAQEPEEPEEPEDPDELAEDPGEPEDLDELAEDPADRRMEPEDPEEVEEAEEPEEPEDPEDPEELEEPEDEPEDEPENELSNPEDPAEVLADEPEEPKDRRMEPEEPEEEPKEPKEPAEPEEKPVDPAVDKPVVHILSIRPKPLKDALQTKSIEISKDADILEMFVSKSDDETAIVTYDHFNEFF